MRLSYLVGRIDRVMTSMLEEAIVPLGVTVTELTALSVLALRPGLSNARLARRSLVTPQAMHKVMRSLEENGLVVRASSDRGGRSLHAQITDLGLDVLDRADEILARVERQFTQALDSSERDELERLLRKLTSVEAAEPGPDTRSDPLDTSSGPA